MSKKKKAKATNAVKRRNKKRPAKKVPGVFTVFTGNVSSSLKTLVREIGRTPTVLLLVLIALFAISFAVRLSFLFQPIHYDEAYTFHVFVSDSFFKIITDYSVPNNHILHSLLLRPVTELLGSAEWVLRLPALTAGLCLVPAVFFLGLRARNMRVGLWAAGLTAVSSFLVEFSVNARGYAMICLFTAVLLTAVLKLRVSHRSKSAWTVFILASVAGLYTIPVMLYPICLAALWLLLGADLPSQNRRGAVLLPLVVTSVVIVCGAMICYAPVIMVSGKDSILFNDFVRSLPMGEVVKRSYGLAIELLHLYHRDLPIPMAILLAGGFLLGCFRLPRLVLASLLTVSLLLLIQRVVPFPRVFTFGMVIYLLLAAAGFEKAVEWLLSKSGTKRREFLSAGLPLIWAVTAGLFLVIKGGVATSREVGYFPEAQEAVEYLLVNCGERDVFFAKAPANEPLKYYGARKGLNRYGFALPGGVLPRSVKLVVDSREESVDEVISSYALFSNYFGNPELMATIGSAEIYNLESVSEEKSIDVSKKLSLDFLSKIRSKKTLGQEDVMNGIRLAYDFLQLKEYEPAMEICKIILEDQPAHEITLHIMGRIYHEKSDIDKAKYYYKRVLDNNPEDVATLINMGMIARSEKKYEQAKLYYYRALRKDSTSAQAHFNLGNLFFSMDNMGEAEDHYKYVVRVNPKEGMAHYYLALLYLKEGNRSVEALKHFQIVRKLLPAQADQLDKQFIIPLKAYLQAEPADTGAGGISQ
jgi:tetratricopeptide (TPR) repeat protein